MKCLDMCSERIAEAEGNIFLVHPIAVMIVTTTVVIKARIYEDGTADIFVDPQTEGVFPFVLHTMERRVSLHACLPTNGI